VGVLYQFVLRLAFGLAFSMWLSPPAKITSGFFRNHLYVALGLCVLATTVAFTEPGVGNYQFPLATSVLAYGGAVIWLYEKRLAGQIALGLIALATVGCAIDSVQASSAMTGSAVVTVMWLLDPILGGLVLGTTITAMFLGHWYLNTPSMQLEPLKRLILLMAIAVVLRATHSGAGFVMMSLHAADQIQIPFLILRWLSGIAAPLMLAWMTWKTLAIPNTQSATGILYVGVITTFTGELAAELLSVGCLYPL
jgi:hypothetical protein